MDMSDPLCQADRSKILTCPYKFGNLREEGEWGTHGMRSRSVWGIDHFHTMMRSAPLLRKTQLGIEKQVTGLVTMYQSLGWSIQST